MVKIKIKKKKQCLGKVSEETSERVEAHGKLFHTECFKCTQCAIPLTPQDFYLSTLGPLCQQHKPDKPEIIVAGEENEVEKI